MSGQRRLCRFLALTLPIHAGLCQFMPLKISNLLYMQVLLTDSKSDGGLAAPRGFESSPLRQFNELRPVSLTGFHRKNAIVLKLCFFRLESGLISPFRFVLCEEPDRGLDDLAFPFVALLEGVEARDGSGGEPESDFPPSSRFALLLLLPRRR